MNLKVYADEAVKPAATKALEDWKKALASVGVTLNVTFANDVHETNLAILDADNQTTRLDIAEGSVGVENDSDFEFSRLAGLSMTTKRLMLVDADQNDKYNRSGTFKKGSDFKHTDTIVQLNSEVLSSFENQTKVLKHEIGHLFGLEHDDNDTLMTTRYTDKVFTGEISKKDIELAKKYLTE